MELISTKSLVVKDKVEQGTEEGAAEVEEEEAVEAEQGLEDAPEEEEPEHVAEDVEQAAGAVEEGVGHGCPGLQLAEVLAAEGKPVGQEAVGAVRQFSGEKDVEQLLEDKDAHRDEK